METLTCRHDDPSKDLPACVRGGEVVREISKLVQNQAGHRVGQHLGPQQGSGASRPRGHQGALPLREGTGGFPPAGSHWQIWQTYVRACACACVCVPSPTLLGNRRPRNMRGHGWNPHRVSEDGDSPPTVTKAQGVTPSWGPLLLTPTALLPRLSGARPARAGKARVMPSGVTHRMGGAGGKGNLKGHPIKES